MKFHRAILFFASLLLTPAAAASPESDFWTWFQRNDARLFDFEKNQGAIFAELASEMGKIDPSLTFEFGPKEQGRREFVISAGGIQKAFPSVEKLFRAAPLLKRWKVIKFRPRRPPFDLEYQGVSVKVATVSVTISADGRKPGLTVFIPGYSKAKHETYGMIAFLLLDQALGEFDVETRVGAVEVAAPSSGNPQAIPLSKLPKEFDKLIAR